jgi:hypothetical protein
MPDHGDPYMRDPNVRHAASMVQLGWPALLAGIGAGMSGWFGFESWLGIGGGIVLGIVIASVTLSQYGGRSTR